MFHTRSFVSNRSLTEKEGNTTRFAFGIGLKFGIKGIHGESQLSTFKPLEIEIHAPNSTTLRFFNNPFQSQEERGLEEAFKKEIPLVRYLVPRHIYNLFQLYIQAFRFSGSPPPMEFPTRHMCFKTTNFFSTFN
jgi:hypothetical protein